MKVFKKGSENPSRKPHKRIGRICPIRLFHKVWLVIHPKHRETKLVQNFNRTRIREMVFAALGSWI